MRPIFQDLAHLDLLNKCLHGKTQNCNESLNNVIWSRVPKTTFVHMETLSFGVRDAVACFNIGNIARMQVLNKMCIQPGAFTTATMKRLDQERLLRARYAHSLQTKEKRKAKMMKRKREEGAILKNPQNVAYGAGNY